MGRVVELAVDEGQKVAKGQFLMQIDPRNQRTSPDAARRPRRRPLAARAAARELAAARGEPGAVAREPAPADRAVGAAAATRQALDAAESEVKVREANLRDAEQSARDPGAAHPRAGRLRRRAPSTSCRGPASSRHRRPGLRRNIEAGETVVIGTMNNAGTVLLQIADMSIIEAEVEVDETDIPSSRSANRRRSDRRDPDKTFTGKVTEVGNSPIRPGRRRTTASRDQLQGHRDDRRPVPRGASRLHLHRRRHDGDAGPGGGGAHPGDGRARSGLRPGRQHRSAAHADPKRAAPTVARPNRFRPARGARKRKASS